MTDDQGIGMSLMDRIRQRSAEADTKPLLMDPNGQLADRPLSPEFVRDAINRAYQLYNGTGDVEGAMIFMSVTCCHGKVTDECLAWAKERMDEIYAAREQLS
jgi:hypothetical protein